MTLQNLVELCEVSISGFCSPVYIMEEEEAISEYACESYNGQLEKQSLRYLSKSWELFKPRRIKLISHSFFYKHEPGTFDI